MLLPARTEVARQLRQYRAWERATLASPADRAVRTTFEDAGYTLCVLMGKRCAREAADAAERYLRPAPGSAAREPSPREPLLREPSLREPGGRGPAVADRRGRPVTDRRFPAGT